MSVYLDSNATTPLAPEVISAIQKSLVEAWGNPSSSYPTGIKAKDVIDQARKHVAECINAATTADVIFTSGGSESNNWVIHAAINFFNSSHSNIADPNCKPHIVTSTVEHDSISAPLDALLEKGEIELTRVPIDENTGEVSVASVIQSIRPNTCLVTVMMANNETGTIMPIQEIAAAVRSREKYVPLIHTDAAQTIGKILVNVQELDVDFLTIVGHKFYGPRIGALYVKNLRARSSQIQPFIYGGGQESGFRAGTENTPMIAGLGAACKLVIDNLTKYNKAMTDTRNFLENRLLETFGKRRLSFNCKSNNRLPNTCNVSVLGHGLEGYKVLQLVKGFSCSTGSACHSGKCKPSRILKLFHVPDEVAANAIRISTGRNTKRQDIETVVDELYHVISSLQQ